MLGSLSDEMKIKMDDLISGMMRKNAAEASVTRPIDKYSAPEIMQEYLELLKIEHVKASGIQRATPVVDEAGTLLQAVQFSVKSLASEPMKVDESLAPAFERLKKPDINVIDVIDSKGGSKE